MEKITKLTLTKEICDCHISFYNWAHFLHDAFLQDAFPMRLKRVIIVNQPSLFTYVYNITRPFMRAKMFQRVSIAHCDGNWSKSVSREWIQDFGKGGAGSCKPLKRVAFLSSFFNFFFY